MDYITVTAKNLDDAITEALVQLEVTSDRLDYEVIEKGSNGLLGFGRKQALPVLSAFTQYLNMKLSMAVNGSNRPADKDDPTVATMRTMNMTMPLFSLVMVFTLPTGIGIYWIVSAIVRMVQQVFINKHLSKMSVDDMIEKNKEKAQKKKEKRGEKAEKINAMAQTNTKSIKSSATKSSSMPDKEREEKLEKARANAKPGSLASKANMVKNFNENK